MSCWKNSLPSLKILSACLALTLIFSTAVNAGETQAINRSDKPHHIYVGTGLLFNNFSLGYRYHFAPQWALGGYVGPNLWGSAGSTGFLIGPNLRYYLSADPSTFFIEASAYNVVSTVGSRFFESGTLLGGFEFRTDSYGIFSAGAGIDITQVGLVPAVQLNYGWAF
jgi:hypothetical protein